MSRAAFPWALERPERLFGMVEPLGIVSGDHGRRWTISLSADRTALHIHTDLPHPAMPRDRAVYTARLLDIAQNLENQLNKGDEL